MENSDIPVQVLNVKNAVAIDIHAGMGVAVDRDGYVWFWGSYSLYSVVYVKEPVKISRLKDVIAIDIVHVRIYLLKKDGTVWYIEVDPNAPKQSVHPKQVTGFDFNNIKEISNYLVLKTDGTLRRLPSYTFTNGDLVVGLGDIIEFDHVIQRRTVILKKDSTVWAWGLNDFGQLGNGTYANSTVPVRVGELTDVIAISANYDYSLALRKDGTVWFWGLEDPYTKKGRNLPVKIEGLDDVSLIYAAKESIVMKNDGSCWVFDSEERLPQNVPFD